MYGLSLHDEAHTHRSARHARKTYNNGSTNWHLLQFLINSWTLILLRLYEIISIVFFLSMFAVGQCTKIPRIYMMDVLGGARQGLVRLGGGRLYGFRVNLMGARRNAMSLPAYPSLMHDFLHNLFFEKIELVHLLFACKYYCTLNRDVLLRHWIKGGSPCRQT